MKPVLIALAAVSLLAGCQRNAEAPAQADAPPAQPQADTQVTEAVQAAPLTYSRDTAYADVELTLPASVIPYPDLHASLYRRGRPARSYGIHRRTIASAVFPDGHL